MPDLSRLRSDVGAFVDAIDWPLTRPVFLEPLGFHPAKRVWKNVMPNRPVFTRRDPK
jgi:hypothetical protein